MYFLPFGKNAYSIFAYLYEMSRFVSQQSELCIFRASASVGALFYYKGEIIMPDYKSMYFELFNSVTDAMEILSEAQKRAEEAYIDAEEDEDTKNPITR